MKTAADGSQVGPNAGNGAHATQKAGSRAATAAQEMIPQRARYCPVAAPPFPRPHPPVSPTMSCGP